MGRNFINRNFNRKIIGGNRNIFAPDRSPSCVYYCPSIQRSSTRLATENVDEKEYEKSMFCHRIFKKREFAVSSSSIAITGLEAFAQ